MKGYEQLIIKGVNSGQKAFCGPKTVQIDLTGKCNNDCIGCWVHSPLIKNPPRDKNLTLPFSKIKNLVISLARSGTQEIFLSGAGETFLHPEILEIVGLIKKQGMKINIITNFTLMDKDKARRLIELEADLITASIWAGTAGTYCRTHPSKNADDFQKIKDSLRLFSAEKRKAGKYLPQIKIYNVICNLNYREISAMIDFALEAEADFVEFQIMDIVPQETDSLALSKSDVERIKQEFLELKKHKDLYFKEVGVFALERDSEFKEFPGRFLKVPAGFALKESILAGKEIAHHFLECPAKFISQSSSMNPLIIEGNNEIIFSFSRESCGNCRFFSNSCPVDNEYRLKLHFLKILGFGSFSRRLSSADIYGQLYEKELIENLPCYAGWTYARVLSSGEVVPCCKASNKPLGNIFKGDFHKIWQSKNYREFRSKALSLPKSDHYFTEIDCLKSCDNVGMNLQMKDMICGGGNLGDELVCERSASGEKNLPRAKKTVPLEVARFKKGNLNLFDHDFGEGLAIDGGHGFSEAECEVDFTEQGVYEIWSCYASDDPRRSLELYLDGRLVKKEALGNRTGGWNSGFLLWFEECSLFISSGTHNFKIVSREVIPHIHGFAFLKNVKKARIRMFARFRGGISAYLLPFKAFHSKARQYGLISATKRLYNYVRSGRMFNNYLDIMGIFHGKIAFKGPFHVQIDLTNFCNNDCLACWCNSPLLEEKAFPLEKKHVLPFGMVKELIDELALLGTKEIYFSGGGEPFMHPQIMEILAYAKKNNFTCYVNTNFTLLDKAKLQKLAELGVDHLTVSIWSGTENIYAATHPNKSAQTFREIVENLKFLNQIKKQKPFIKVYNVIFNLNFHEIEEMVELAGQTCSESVEFTLVDTIPGKTDKLLLTAQQTRELQKSVEKILQGLDKNNCYKGVLIFGLESFLRRISSSEDLLKATYDRNIIDKIPCYIGWCFARVMPNGDVNACLKAHRIPTGNLYKERFVKIWNGRQQVAFRKKTRVKKKDDPFFRLIGNDPEIKEAGCYKSCDDIGRNLYMHNRIMALTPLERYFVKAASRMAKKPDLSAAVLPRILPADPLLKGVVEGRNAFCGPEQVVIDITNRCNEKCIGCWTYSPLLKNKPPREWFNQELEFEKARELIASLAQLGTKRIRFTGGGEPFMHPRIFDLIQYTKERGLICCLTTNFSLVNEEKISRIISLGVDELAISLWAARADTYCRTHPGSTPENFKRICDNLSSLIRKKKDRPFVTLCNVICSLNHSETEEMFDFALNRGSDGVYFTLVDALDGTGTLLLDAPQRAQVLLQARAIRRKWHGLPAGKKINLDYFDGFLSRLKAEGTDRGEYDRQRVNQIPCYAGWIFSRILADGGVSVCCRGVKKIMGNINTDSFSDIWFSEQYNDFRSMAKYASKTSPYFNEIGCIKECDNLMHNEEFHRRISSCAGGCR
ncbi:MAG: radical SAM protein [Candidatus Omnitrophica bacterium]|nr:radical SAM protein [Candidatus Omnitrophota bacterium]